MLNFSNVLLPIHRSAAVALERASAAVPPASSAGADWQRLRAEVRSLAGGQAYDDVVGAIRTRVHAPCGFVVVRGLRFDPNHSLLVSIVTELGELLTLDTMVPRMDYHAIVNTAGEMYLHTDGTRWRRPNRYTCQQAQVVEPDGGGQSRVIGIDDLLNSISLSKQPGLLSFLLNDAVPWGLDAANGGELMWSPIVHNGKLRWARFAVGPEDGSAADISDHLMSDIEAFHRFLQTCPDITSMSLEPNDLLVIDNHRCLHGRGPMHDRLSSARRLVRARLAERASPSAGD